MLLYQYINLYGITAAAIPVLTFSGFVVVGGRATKLSGVICALISALVFAAAEYVSMIVQTAVDIERDGGGIEIARSADIINLSLREPETLQMYLPETLVGIGLILVIGTAYFIKRKLTRPMRVSKNLL